MQFGRISVCPVVRSTTLGAVCRGSGNLPSSGLDLRYVWDTGGKAFILDPAENRRFALEAVVVCIFICQIGWL